MIDSTYQWRRKVSIDASTAFRRFSCDRPWYNASWDLMPLFFWTASTKMFLNFVRCCISINLEISLELLKRRSLKLVIGILIVGTCQSLVDYSWFTSSFGRYTTTPTYQSYDSQLLKRKPSTISKISNRFNLDLR